MGVHGKGFVQVKNVAIAVILFKFPEGCEAVRDDGADEA